MSACCIGTCSNIDFIKLSRVVKQMRSKMNHNAAFVQLPIGLEKECQGILDLIEERAIYFEGDYGEKVRYDEVPKDRRTEVQERRHELIEHLSNVDESLGELHLNCTCKRYYLLFLKFELYFKMHKSVQFMICCNCKHYLDTVLYCLDE